MKTAQKAIVAYKIAMRYRMHGVMYALTEQWAWFHFSCASLAVNKSHDDDSFLLNHANYQQVDWERELRQALEWSR